ncbi:hypothetical protein SHIRM173S_12760 [Streptomyces hirsutus]
MNQPARLGSSGGGASTHPSASRPTAITGASTWIVGIRTRLGTEYGSGRTVAAVVAPGTLLSAAATAGCGGPSSNSPEPFRMSARPVSRTSAITPHGARLFRRASSSNSSGSKADIRLPLSTRPSPCHSRMAETLNAAHATGDGTRGERVAGR